MNIYLQYGVMYFIGMLVHLLAVKIPSVKKRDEAANIKFSFREYVKQEWPVLVANVFLGAGLIIGFDEIANWKPEVMSFAKWLFAALGAVGSSTIMAKFSSYEKKVLSIIDVKTNIGDAVTETPVTTVAEAPKKIS